MRNFTDDELKDMLKKLSKGEKMGIAYFGLFPGDKIPMDKLSHEDTIRLMELAKEVL